MKKGIIIGGGIGGLTTALALQKKGIIAKVYETATEIKPVGAGIWLASNALNVLNRLNVFERVKQRGIMMNEAKILDIKGSLLQYIDNNLASSKFGFGTLAIHRAHLIEELLRSINNENILLNKRCISISEENDKIKVGFEDGSTEEADFLIGADGIRSFVRKEIIGGIDLRYSGQSCWRGIAEFTLPLEYRKTGVEIWGTHKGLRFGFSQVTSNHVYFFAVLKTFPNQQDDRNTIKQKLLDLFKSFPDVVTDIISATRSEKIMRHDLYDFKPIKTWVKGKIALLGDAAHATTPNLGQGGAQAIEDSFVIADCISKYEKIEDALNAYQKIRVEKAINIVNTSYQIARLTNLSGRIPTSIRNFIVRNTPSALARKQVEKIYSLNY